jgi:NAD(P)-dependent dehydrogenase (short-subunit alcohol dehydrogenase family)
VATGLCHADLSAREGRIPSPLPGVLGHEGAGIIEELGEGVSDLEVGDHVVMSFTFCGRCHSCRTGHPVYCETWAALNLFYSATKSAVNMLSAVARVEFADDGVVVSTVYPTATETEFHDRLAAGERLSNTGLTVHTAQYVAQAIAYAIRTGEAEVIIPRGPEQPGLFDDADPDADAD